MLSNNAFYTFIISPVPIVESATNLIFRNSSVLISVANNTKFRNLFLIIQRRYLTPAIGKDIRKGSEWQLTGMLIGILYDQ